MDIKWIVEMIADNPPSIAIAGGILLFFFGRLLDDQPMTSFGTLAFFAGVVLQALWLYYVKRR